MNEQAVKNLAEAIINEARKDFRIAVRKYRIAESNRGRKNAMNTIREIAEFFKSDWFVQLSDGANGHEVLAKLVEVNDITEEELEAFGI